MSKHGRSGAMAVRPQELQTPEDDLALEDRLAPAPGPVLLHRIAEARALRAPDGAACRACWQAGLVAALDAMAGPGGAEAARTLDPGGLHWRACWLEGRNAAIAAVEG